MQMKPNMQKLNAFQEIQASAHLYSNPLSVPIFQCFNWVDMFEKHGFTDNVSFYVVTFRTVRRKDADEKLLQKTEAAIEREAKNSSGLLLYLKGKPNSGRECFSISIWDSREAAEKAIQVSAYKEAMSFTPQLYESYILEQYLLTGTADNFPAFELIDVKKINTN